MIDQGVIDLAVGQLHKQLSLIITASSGPVWSRGGK